MNVVDAGAAAARVLVFDSGLGGLTVFAGIAEARPDVELIYAADDAFFPYGALGEAALVARVGSVMAIADRAPRARPRGDRLQHRLDAGPAAAAGRLSAAALRRHGAGDQAGRRGLADRA